MALLIFLQIHLKDHLIQTFILNFINKKKYQSELSCLCGPLLIYTLKEKIYLTITGSKSIHDYDYCRSSPWQSESKFIFSLKLYEVIHNTRRSGINWPLNFF